jgi:type II secretory pathway pseudopilin PulG
VLYFQGMSQPLPLARRVSGWTLIETLVALSVASLILVVMSRILADTSAWTSEQSLRTAALGRLQGTVREFERHLQRSAVPGIAWQAASGSAPAVLAIHCQDTAAITTTVKYEPFYRVYQWSPQSKELRHLDCPPGVAVAAPSPLRPRSPSPAEMATLTSSSFANTHTVSTGLTQLNMQVLDGPLVQIDLEYEFTLLKRPWIQKIQTTRVIHLRNRL